jgi:outer membrane immunogenic protein
MKKVLFLIAAVLLPSVSSAADMAVKTQPVAPAVALYNWTGFYIGGNVGYAWNRTDVSAIPNAAFASDFPGTTAFIAANHPSRLTKDGFTGGGQVGYNWQAGQWVAGVEADINYVDSRRSFAFGAGNVVPLSVSGSLATDWLATFRGRVGFAANNVLLYATGGLAVAELKYNETVAVVGNVSGLGTFAASIRDTKAGWTAGAGVEWGFAPNWSAKFEYLYTQFDGVSAVAPRVGVLPPITPNPTFTFATGDWTIQTARVGINYRFGGPVY